jgi:hypothetical protein
MRSFIICTPHQYYQDDQIKDNEMGRACSRNGENCTGQDNLNETYHLEQVGTDGRATVKWVLRKPDARMWIGFI